MATTEKKNSAHTKEKPVEKQSGVTSQLLLGLLFGLIFGFLLQKGGVAKYHVLIGVLLLKDFTVVKVMLSAIVVGTVGLRILRARAREGAYQADSPRSKYHRWTYLRSRFWSHRLLPRNRCSRARTRKLRCHRGCARADCGIIPLRRDVRMARPNRDESWRLGRGDAARIDSRESKSLCASLGASSDAVPDIDQLLWGSLVRLFPGPLV